MNAKDAVLKVLKHLGYKGITTISAIRKAYKIKGDWHDILMHLIEIAPSIDAVEAREYVDFRAYLDGFKYDMQNNVISLYCDRGYIGSIYRRGTEWKMDDVKQEYNAAYNLYKQAVLQLEAPLTPSEEIEGMIARYLRCRPYDGLTFKMRFECSYSLFMQGRWLGGITYNKTLKKYMAMKSSDNSPTAYKTAEGAFNAVVHNSISKLYS